MSNTFIPGSLLQPKSRPSFPYYYLMGAQWAAKRGDCTRRQVGALLVDINHLVMPGYNGTPEHGQPGCLDGACPRGRMSHSELPPYAGDYSNCIAVHAEENALRKARYVDGFYLYASSVYVTAEPCSGCYELLADAGVKDVWWCVEEMWEPGGSPGYRNLFDN